LRGITLNYTAAQVANFNSIRDLILGTHTRDIISFRRDSKIKRKIRIGVGSGLAGAETIAIVSQTAANKCRVLFHKHSGFDDFDSVHFGYEIDEHNGCSF